MPRSRPALGHSVGISAETLHPYGTRPRARWCEVGCKGPVERSWSQGPEWSSRADAGALALPCEEFFRREPRLSL